jgi:hypothetical protein
VTNFPPILPQIFMFFSVVAIPMILSASPANGHYVTLLQSKHWMKKSQNVLV